MSEPNSITSSPDGRYEVQTTDQQLLSIPTSNVQPLFTLASSYPYPDQNVQEGILGQNSIPQTSYVPNNQNKNFASDRQIFNTNQLHQGGFNICRTSDGHQDATTGLFHGNQQQKDQNQHQNVSKEPVNAAEFSTSHVSTPTRYLNHEPQADLNARCSFKQKPNQRTGLNTYLKSCTDLPQQLIRAPNNQTQSHSSFNGPHHGACTRLNSCYNAQSDGIQYRSASACMGSDPAQCQLQGSDQRSALYTEGTGQQSLYPSSNQGHNLGSDSFTECNRLLTHRSSNYTQNNIQPEKVPISYNSQPSNWHYTPRIKQGNSQSFDHVQTNDQLLSPVVVSTQQLDGVGQMPVQTYDQQANAMDHSSRQNHKRVGPQQPTFTATLSPNSSAVRPEPVYPAIQITPSVETDLLQSQQSEAYRNTCIQLIDSPLLKDVNSGYQHPMNSNQINFTNEIDIKPDNNVVDTSGVLSETLLTNSSSFTSPVAHSSFDVTANKTTGREMETTDRNQSIGNSHNTVVPDSCPVHGKKTDTGNQQHNSTEIQNQSLSLEDMPASLSGGPEVTHSGSNGRFARPQNPGSNGRIQLTSLSRVQPIFQCPAPTPANSPVNFTNSFSPNNNNNRNNVFNRTSVPLSRDLNGAHIPLQSSHNRTPEVQSNSTQENGAPASNHSSASNPHKINEVNRNVQDKSLPHSGVQAPVVNEPTLNNSTSVDETVSTSSVLSGSQPVTTTADSSRVTRSATNTSRQSQTPTLNPASGETHNAMTAQKRSSTNSKSPQNHRNNKQVKFERLSPARAHQDRVCEPRVCPSTVGAPLQMCDLSRQQRAKTETHSTVECVLIAFRDECTTIHFDDPKEDRYILSYDCTDTETVVRITRKRILKDDGTSRPIKKEKLEHEAVVKKELPDDEQKKDDAFDSNAKRGKDENTQKHIDEKDKDKEDDELEKIPRLQRVIPVRGSNKEDKNILKVCLQDINMEKKKEKAPKIKKDKEGLDSKIAKSKDETGKKVKRKLKEEKASKEQHTEIKEKDLKVSIAKSMDKIKSKLTPKALTRRINVKVIKKGIKMHRKVRMK